jgi:hypothetical protein
MRFFATTAVLLALPFGFTSLLHVTRSLHRQAHERQQTPEEIAANEKSGRLRAICRV